MNLSRLLTKLFMSTYLPDCTFCQPKWGSSIRTLTLTLSSNIGRLWVLWLRFSWQVWPFQFEKSLNITSHLIQKRRRINCIDKVCAKSRPIVPWQDVFRSYTPIWSMSIFMNTEHSSKLYHGNDQHIGLKFAGEPDKWIVDGQLMTML